jgi:predicted Holliday junction resolvase-like endonuclease
MIISLIFVIITLAILFHRERTQRKEFQEQFRNVIKNLPQSGNTIPMEHFRKVMAEKETKLLELHENSQKTEKELSELKSQNQSKSVRLGLISENVLPFHNQFPYDVKNLVPMFRPVDYIVFEEERIVFLEIKMGTSQLSEKQRNIRRLIEEKKVYFSEHRISETGYTIKEEHGEKEDSKS